LQLFDGRTMTARADGTSSSATTTLPSRRAPKRLDSGAPECVAVVAAFACLLAGAAAAADTCEPLRAQIDTKIRDAGVEHFTLSVVDAAASVPGKVVGSCASGAKKIVYVRGQADAVASSPSNGGKSGTAAAGASRSDAILTECKDGTVSVSGGCGKQ
jgi:hypothetical protein